MARKRERWKRYQARIDPRRLVFIDETCIGCGNCERNCPYGVIHMAGPAPPQPNLLSWLMFGGGPDGKGEADHGAVGKSNAPKKAVKCDMCKDQSGGPACVRACPTGAALRVSPAEFIDFVNASAAAR